MRLVQTGNVGVAEYLDKPNNKKWISEDTFDRLHCEEVLPGDILISRLPEPAGRACIMPLLGTKMITAVDCTIVRTAPDMSNKFLVQYLSSQAYFDDVNTCLAGGTRQRISRGNLANFNVPIPVKKTEQDAIGMFFGYLDNLITLHQRQPFLHSPPDISLIVQLTPPFYTFSWEQRKWINTVDISTNMVDPKSGKYDLLPHVAPGNIESFTGRLYDNVKLVGEENLISGKFVFNVGDIVYGKINPQLGKYVFARFSGLTSADAYVLNAKNGIVQKFLYAVIQTRDFYDYSVSVSKRSGMPKINRDELNAYSYWAPSESEQLKIGEYLLTLDHLITLHQRKFEKLTNVKKSMLEKMFPQNGSSYPEIRFKGFTDPWEQRKLASLCEKFTDGDWIESKDQSDFGVRLVQTGNVGVAEYLDKPNNKKWISEDTFDRLHCEEVLPGDILISRLPEPAGRACIMPLLGTKMITAVDCTIVRTAPDMSNKFLVQYLSSQAYFDDVNTCLAGGTRQRISRGNLANFNVPIPVKKTEQDAIGMFFGYLDNLITLHQRELEKLQNIKKSMLEKMFV